MYQLTDNLNFVLRLSDGAMIPLPPGESEGFKYAAWLAAGNTPEPAPVPPVAERQAAAWERIKTYRDQRKASGVLVGSNWFHSDDSSRIQQLGLTIMGANMPPGIMWKTMSGSFVQMTPMLAAQIFQATAANDQAVFSVAEGHRIAMEASQNPEAYDFMTGWPPVFGEV